MIQRMILFMAIALGICKGQGTTNVSDANQEKATVVVMEIFGQNIIKKDLLDLTNVLEKELQNTGVFTLIDRSKITPILREYGVSFQECITVPWVVRIGKKLGVDKVVMGSVNNHGIYYTAHIRTVDIQKQQIDRSATEVCHLCSMDILLLRKMRNIARKLAGLEIDEDADAPLFTQPVGPLVKLDGNYNDSDDTGQRPFQDWREKKAQQYTTIGTALFATSAALILLENVIWTATNSSANPLTRSLFVCSEAALAYGAVPLWVQSLKLSKNNTATNHPSPRSRITKGIMTGITISQFNLHNYNALTEYQALSRFTIGSVVQFPIHPFIAFQSEIMYTHNGIRYTSLAQPAEVTLNLHYCTFPQSIKNFLPLRRAVTPFLSLGLAPAWCIKGTEIYKTTATGKSSTTGIENMSRFDLGFIYGVGIDWALKKGVCSLTIRRTEGIVDTELGSSWDELIYPKNRSFALLCGYSF